MRTTREILPSETWERVNSLYLSVARRSTKGLPRSARHSVLNNIVHSCQQITGLLAGSMNHDAAYQFIRIGRNLERADMSTRIIDAASMGLMGDKEDVMPFRNVLWISVLQSLSAYQMYRLNVQRNVSPEDVLAFLFQSRVFPRSVAHCLREIEVSMKALPGNGPALDTTIAVQRDLKSRKFDDLVGHALHEFIDDLQIQLIQVHHAISDNWFHPGEA